VLRVFSQEKPKLIANCSIFAVPALVRGLHTDYLPSTGVVHFTKEIRKMDGRIYITDTDSQKLRRLIAGLRGAKSPGVEHLDMLEQELDRAEVVASEAIPRDVITMNSEVRMHDLDSGSSQRYKLVFPSQFRWDFSVSVLAPIGTAMLGYRVGDVIEWPVPRGIRRLKVQEVIYQPEAAGVIEDEAHPATGAKSLGN
jgi:regulator of nucleoside diphosphate kinase